MTLQRTAHSRVAIDAARGERGQDAAVAGSSAPNGSVGTTTIPAARPGGTAADCVVEAVIPRTPVTSGGVGQPPVVRLGALVSDGSLRCALASVDGRGRVAQRSLVRACGWLPGQRLDVGESHGVLVVHRDDDGDITVTGQGYFRIPAALRRWCAVRPGDRVLLVAALDAGVLVVHPMRTVEAMVVHYYTNAAG